MGRNKNIIKGALISLLTYGLLETMISGLNIVSVVKTVAKQKEVYEQEYKPRHQFMFDFSKPDKLRGFKPKKGRYALLTYVNDEFDEFGFKKGEVEKEGRIVAVGDSFTYGYNVSHEFSWPSILENMIGEPIINLGVVGYAPWQYNEVMKSNPKPNLFRGKIILYAIAPNDYVPENEKIAENYYHYEGWDKYANPTPTLTEMIEALEKEKGFFQRTATYEFVYKWLYEKKLIERKKEVVIDDPNTDFRLGLRYNGNGITEEQTSEESLRVVNNEFSEAVEIARNQGAILVPVLIPSKLWSYRQDYLNAFGDIDHVTHEDYLMSHAKEFFSKNGIYVIDLRDVLSKAAAKNEKPLYSDDEHFTAVGNVIVAQFIERMLAVKGYVN